MFAILGAWVACCGALIAGVASEPIPVPDAVAEAFSAVQANLTQLASAQKAVAALADASAKLKAAQESLAASRAALTKALDDAANNVPVVPPVVKTVSLVVISSDSCAPCKILEPVLAKLQGEGIPIVITKDPQDVIKWKAVVTPSLIMLVDEKEVSRSSGSLTEGQVRTWFLETVAWAKKTK